MNPPPSALPSLEDDNILVRAMSALKENNKLETHLRMPPLPERGNHNPPQRRDEPQAETLWGAFLWGSTLQQIGQWVPWLARNFNLRKLQYDIQGIVSLFYDIPPRDINQIVGANLLVLLYLYKTQTSKERRAMAAVTALCLCAWSYADPRTCPEPENSEDAKLKL